MNAPFAPAPSLVEHFSDDWESPGPSPGTVTRRPFLIPSGAMAATVVAEDHVFPSSHCTCGQSPRAADAFERGLPR